MEELKKRKTPRYQGFDYNSAGVYFITICTQNRRCILSNIVGTGVLDCPSVTGVLDCPSVTGVLDCPRVELTRYGKIADKYIKQLNEFYNHLSVENYVIMPNHIHLLVWVKENLNTIDNGQSRTPVPTDKENPNMTDNGQSCCSATVGASVPTNIERSNSACSQFVSTFKRFCNKEYGENIWQARFYDHIIRNREDYEKHLRYIYENPLRWYYDELYTEE